MSTHICIPPFNSTGSPFSAGRYIWLKYISRADTSIRSNGNKVMELFGHLFHRGSVLLARSSEVTYGEKSNSHHVEFPDTHSLQLGSTRIGEVFSRSGRLTPAYDEIPQHVRPTSRSNTSLKPPIPTNRVHLCSQSHTGGPGSSRPVVQTGQRQELRNTLPHNAKDMPTVFQRS